MFPDFYLRDGLNLTLARQHGDELRREMARIRMGQMVVDGQAKARRHFFRMYWIRKFLFRLSSRLAYKLVMTNDTESPVPSGGVRNHVGS